jgi:hypothetical protein
VICAAAILLSALTSEVAAAALCDGMTCSGRLQPVKHSVATRLNDINLRSMNLRSSLAIAAPAFSDTETLTGWR